MLLIYNMYHITTIILIIFTVLYYIPAFIMLIVSKPAYGRALGTFLLILGLLTFIIMCADQECIITGPCVIWGWVRFALIFVFLILPITILSIIGWVSRTDSIESTKEEN